VSLLALSEIGVLFLTQWQLGTLRYPDQRVEGLAVLFVQLPINGRRVAIDRLIADLAAGRARFSGKSLRAVYSKRRLMSWRVSL
jgi:hypothetical protein